MPDNKKLFLYFFVFSAVLYFNQSVFSQAGESCVCAKSGKVQRAYEGKEIIGKDFRKIDLTNFSFKGAILKGCLFDGMDLNNVSFENASFVTDEKGNSTSFQNAKLTNICFRNSFLNDVDFQFSSFEKTDFQNAILQFVIFGFDVEFVGGGDCRNNFRDAEILEDGDFGIQLDDVPASFWGVTDFSNTVFHGLSKDNFHPAGRDFSNAILRGVNLDNFDLSGSVFNRADLRNASLKYCVLNDARFNAAQLDSSSLQAGRGKHIQFRNASMAGVNLENGVFTYSNFQNARLSGAKIVNSTLVGDTFDQVYFTGNKEGLLSPALISDSDFSKSTFFEASINRLDFGKSRFRGAIFTQNTSTIEGSNFSYCNLEGAKFERGTLEGVNFSNTILTNTSFEGATLRGDEENNPVNFTCSFLGGTKLLATVENANFFNALVPTDLNGCCPTQGGGTLDCGKSVFNTPFDATILPTIYNTEVICPDGSRAQCKEKKNWVVKDVEKACQRTEESQVWLFPNCAQPGPEPVDPTDIVLFKDKKLEKAVKMALGIEEGKPVTKTLASMVSKLDCSASGITSIEGLEFFTDLEDLNLSRNGLQTADFSKLDTGIVSLDVSHNQLSELKISTKFKKLRRLNASYNKIALVSSFSGLGFSFLDLSHNRLDKQLSLYIKPNKNLTYCDLSYNKIKMDKALARKCVNVQTLYLQFNELKNIGPISSLEYLDRLDLRGNPGYQCEKLGNPARSSVSISCQ